MQMERLPPARQQPDGSLMIPTKTFAFLKAAMADFEKRFTDPRLHYDLDTLRKLRALLGKDARSQVGGVLVSELTRLLLARCLHDLHITFLVEHARDLETKRLSLDKALRQSRLMEVIPAADELLRRAGFGSR